MANAESAEESYRKAAEQGNTKAHLVPRYDDDSTPILVLVVNWFRKAVINWFRTATDQGYADAQCTRGLMCAYGDRVPKDDAQEVNWIRKAAERGLVDAQFTLGLMFADGEGMPKNETQAVNWVRKAAEQGYAYAQVNLGAMYANGHGVPQSLVVAYSLFNLASLDRTTPTGTTLRAKKFRDISIKELTPEQIAAGQRLTSELAKPNNLTKAIAAYLKKSV